MPFQVAVISRNTGRTLKKLGTPVATEADARRALEVWQEKPPKGTDNNRVRLGVVPTGKDAKRAKAEDAKRASAKHYQTKLPDGTPVNLTTYGERK